MRVVWRCFQINIENILRKKSAELKAASSGFLHENVMMITIITRHSSLHKMLNMKVYTLVSIF